MHHSLDAAFGKCKEMYCNASSLIYCLAVFKKKKKKLISR